MQCCLLRVVNKGARLLGLNKGGRLFGLEMEYGAILDKDGGPSDRVPVHVVPVQREGTPRRQLLARVAPVLRIFLRDGSHRR
jgi:hypothetical protein